MDYQPTGDQKRHAARVVSDCLDNGIALYDSEGKERAFDAIYRDLCDALASVEGVSEHG